MARLVVGLSLAVVAMANAAVFSHVQTVERISLRGREQKLHIYGARGGPPVVVSSGDGGWVHLAPHVAQVLADKGFFVVGFDVRAYLSDFTSRSATVRTEDEPGDYRVVAQFAANGTTKKPLLIGVSEGAGLSLLAATDPEMKALVSGVIGIGLPDINELGWRWKDALIYVTHTVPHEPTFSTRAVVDQLSPIPLAVIHSAGDEFVPLAEVQKILTNAGEPKKLWIVRASDHRFSDNLTEFDKRLFEAIAWVGRGGS